MMLGGALAVALAALAVVLATGGADRAAPAAAPTTPARQASASPSAHHAAKSAAQPRATPAPTVTVTRQASTLPPVAAAAATFVGDLQAGVADGQVTQQAGQDLFNHLQPLLFGPSGQNAQQIRQQYDQLVQAYDQHQAQEQVTGSAATALHQALNALGTALGTS